MKEKDVIAMNQVLEYLKSCQIERELFDDFAVAVANCNLQLAKQRLQYRKNAEYHRQKRKEWTEKNPEKVKQHHEAYKKRNEVKRKLEEMKKLSVNEELMTEETE